MQKLKRQDAKALRLEEVADNAPLRRDLAEVVELVATLGP